MRISWKARELVRLENLQRVSEIGRECRKDIERLRQTLPRSGAVDKAVDDRLVRCMAESFDALSDSYIEAYNREGQPLTVSDIQEITDYMMSQVRSSWKARVELEPRGIGTSFLSDLEQTVYAQRQKLVLAMKRMEVYADLAEREAQKSAHEGVSVGENVVYNISGANARVNINSNDSSVNVVNVAPDQLFAEIRRTIETQVESTDEQQELLARVDDLERAIGTPTFLSRYQKFVAALADHVGLFQAFLPALTQLLT